MGTDARPRTSPVALMCALLCERRNIIKLEIRNCSSLIKKLLFCKINFEFFEQKVKQHQQPSTHNTTILLYCSYLFCSKFRNFRSFLVFFLARTSLIFPKKLLLEIISIYFTNIHCFNNYLPTEKG